MEFRIHIIRKTKVTRYRAGRLFIPKAATREYSISNHVKFNTVGHTILLNSPSV